MGGDIVTAEVLRSEPAKPPPQKLLKKVKEYSDDDSAHSKAKPEKPSFSMLLPNRKKRMKCCRSRSKSKRRRKKKSRSREKHKREDKSKEKHAEKRRKRSSSAKKAQRSKMEEENDRRAKEAAELQRRLEQRERRMKSRQPIVLDA